MKNKDTISKIIRSNNISLKTLLNKEIKTKDDISKIKEISSNIESSEQIYKMDEELSKSNVGQYGTKLVTSQLDDSKLILNNSSTMLNLFNIKNIKESKANVLNEINDEINDEYTISFEMALNAFPSKVHKSKSNKYNNTTGIEKNYTSRRSDIISFNYDTVNINNKIEFGAMAPFGLIPNNFHNKRLYEGDFDNFSIAACLTFDDTKKLSLYTDYKFKLGRSYNVKLSIKLINDKYISDLSSELKIMSNNYLVFDGLKMDTSTIEKRIDNLNILRDEVNRFYNIRENYLYQFTERKKQVDTDIFNGNDLQLLRFSGIDYRYITNTDKQAVTDLLLDIKKYNDNINTFGNPAVYDIKLSVNGVLQDVGTYQGKVWGDSAKKQKKSGLIATQPGFRKIISSKVDKQTYSDFIIDRDKLDNIYLGIREFKIVIDDFIITDNKLEVWGREFNNLHKSKLKKAHELLLTLLPNSISEVTFDEIYQFMQNYILNIDNLQNQYPVLSDNLDTLIKNQKLLNKVGFITKIKYVGENISPKKVVATKIDTSKQITFPGLYKMVLGNTTKFKQYYDLRLIINSFSISIKDGVFSSDFEFSYIDNGGEYSWDEMFKYDFRELQYVSFEYLNSEIDIIGKELIIKDKNSKFYKIKFTSIGSIISGFYQEIIKKYYEVHTKENYKKNRFEPNILYTPIYFNDKQYYIKYKNKIGKVDKYQGEYNKNIIDIPINSTITRFFKKIDLNKLRSISTTPYKINTRTQSSGFLSKKLIRDGIDPRTLNEIKSRDKYKSNITEILKEIKETDKLSKYTYKLNTNIKHGSLDIYQNKIENSVHLLTKFIEIDIDIPIIINVLQIERISSEITGSVLNPIVELSIYPKLPTGLILNDDGNIVGSTSIILPVTKFSITAIVYKKEYVTKKFYVDIQTINNKAGDEAEAS